MSSGVWAYDNIFNKVTSRHRRGVHVEHAPRVLRRLKDYAEDYNCCNIRRTCDVRL